MMHQNQVTEGMMVLEKAKLHRVKTEEADEGRLLTMLDKKFSSQIVRLERIGCIASVGEASKEFLYRKMSGLSGKLVNHVEVSRERRPVLAVIPERYMSVEAKFQYLKSFLKRHVNLTWNIDCACVGNTFEKKKVVKPYLISNVRLDRICSFSSMDVGAYLQNLEGRGRRSLTLNEGMMYLSHCFPGDDRSILFGGSFYCWGSVPHGGVYLDRRGCQASIRWRYPNQQVRQDNPVFGLSCLKC